MANDAQMPPQSVAEMKIISNFATSNTVRLVQLVEHQIVVLGVVGSSPTSHPKKAGFGLLFWSVRVENYQNYNNLQICLEVAAGAISRMCSTRAL